MSSHLLDIIIRCVNWRKVTSANLLLGLVLGLALLSIPSGANADLPDPDDIEIEDAQVFRHMLEANDYLCIARYNCAYANESAQPTAPINVTFEFTLTDDEGNIAGNVTAYPFHNYGYGKGIVAFYFEANETGAPEWGDLGNVTIQGTTLFDAPVPSDTYTLTAGDYDADTSPGDIRENFRQFIIANALFLELNWNRWWTALGADTRQVDLLTYLSPQYVVLSGPGETYFGESIDGLRTMCPLIFMFQTERPFYEGQDFNQTQSESFKEFGSGTELETFREGVSEFFGGVGFQTMGTLALAIGMIGLMVLCARKWNKPLVGLLIGYPAALILTRISFGEMAITVGIVSLIAVLILVRAFFQREGAA